MSRVKYRASHLAGYLLLVCLLPVSLVSCAETPRVTPTAATLRIAASSTLSALVDDLGDVYRADTPWLTIQLESIDTGAAFDLLDGGALDLAFVSWLPTELGARLWSSALAQDAVAVIVNVANPTSGLSLAQLRQVFQGQELDWSNLGWGQQELIVVSREDGSGTRAAFEAAVMEGHPVTLNAVVQPDGDAVVGYVARVPGAIGYVSRAQVTGSVRPLAIEGVEPDPVSLASGAYPIRRLLYVVARSEPQGAARDFVAWLLGPDGQQMIAERGFGRVR